MSRKIKELLEHMTITLWDSHQEEITEEHAHDSSCSTCQTLRAATKVLEIGHPSEAGFSTAVSLVSNKPYTYTENDPTDGWNQ